MSSAETAAGTRVQMACKDGERSDIKYTSSPGGFTSETTTSGKDGGAAFVSTSARAPGWSARASAARP
ncbi:MAG: hypothetical protein ABIR73_08315 [Usitatibacter sp.]